MRNAETTSEDRYARFAISGGGGRGMRPRVVQGVPGLDEGGSPFDRFQQFTRMIAKVPKIGADREKGNEGKARQPKRRKS